MKKSKILNHILVVVDVVVGVVVVLVVVGAKNK
jgi:hypothetical protein